MNLLLDTCTFLWVILDSRDLSPAARQAFAEPTNEVFLSSVSVWEIMVKHALGRLPLPEAPGRFVHQQRESHRIRPLDLQETAVFHLAKLPALHSDPFDRMLVCQALAHGLVLVTPDEVLQRYPQRCLW